MSSVGSKSPRPARASEDIFVTPEMLRVDIVVKLLPAMTALQVMVVIHSRAGTRKMRVCFESILQIIILQHEAIKAKKKK